jgi:hypothetical protein
MALLFLASVVAVGIAGAADAHYLIEQDTPAGHVCLLNFELIRDSIVAGDVDGVVTGVYTDDCE